MRKMYDFIYLINIICGFLLVYNYMFVYKTIDNYNLVILIGSYIFYIIVDYLYFRKKFLIDKIDLLVTSSYITICLSMFLFSVIYQFNNMLVFSMAYSTSLLIVPHVIYIVYNLLRCYK